MAAERAMPSMRRIERAAEKAGAGQTRARELLMAAMYGMTGIGSTRGLA